MQSRCEKVVWEGAGPGAAVAGLAHTRQLALWAFWCVNAGPAPTCPVPSCPETRTCVFVCRFSAVPGLAAAAGRVQGAVSAQPAPHQYLLVMGRVPMQGACLCCSWCTTMI